MGTATFEDFEKLDIRIGKIIEVEDFPEAENPSYKIKVDSGKDIGIKKSCAKLVSNYSKEDLMEMLVLYVTNFQPKQIRPIVSEVLILGVPDGKGECVLIKPDKEIVLGEKLY